MVVISITIASFIGLAALHAFHRFSIVSSKQRLFLYAATAFTCISPFLGQDIELTNRLVLVEFHIAVAVVHLTIVYKEQLQLLSELSKATTAK